MNIQEKELQISQLRPFSKHPFKPCTGNYFNQLVESIRDKGIIHPIIVRAFEGEENIYEILSGHNRYEAAKKAGFTTIPARIYANISDDEAVEIVVETNFYQRSFADLLHSEKAKAIAMRHNAIKKQGKRTDLINEKTKTSDGNPHKLTARDKIANEHGLSRETVACYLCINELIPALLNRLDKNEFKLTSAYHVSFISKLGQRDLNIVLNNPKYRLDTKKAKLMRDRYKAQMRTLNCDNIEEILKGENIDTKDKKTPFKLNPALMSKYFRTNITIAMLKLK
ncbi:MAG: ParB/RepB/Spo0J family partition protein [Oscillospiraceae bacterium]|nr:ParB/RepB/Spo0J family partition protein [Oscillospiraceae bacterium]